MRDYIVDQMNKGVSLEDIYIAVEQMFNEEYNKRERESVVNVALDRAAAATAEYFNTVTGSTEFSAEEFILSGRLPFSSTKVSSYCAFSSSDSSS